MKVSDETIRLRLAAFDKQATETRTERHAELLVFARAHFVPKLDQRHAQIEAIGPWESKAFELLSRGVDPGRAALAFVEQFIANAYGDVERGAPL